MQLLMRGDVLVIAPLVDLIAGRRVRWFSWAALLLVAAGLFLTIRSRGGLQLTPLAITTVVLYTMGYFVRLTAMTKTAKSADENRTKGYFVEEKLVAYPVGILCLVLLSVSGFGAQGDELFFGFVAVWRSSQMFYITVLSVFVVLLSVFSILILLDRRENTFCVAFERSASVLAGVTTAYLLASANLGSAPSAAEVVGALLLVVAVVLLAVAPRIVSRRSRIGENRTV
jgi:drug/metabolite transporter (DMT)-like permease